jgi:hypothetical protein
VLCFLCGTGWILKYYLDELQLQRINMLLFLYDFVSKLVESNIQKHKYLTPYKTVKINIFGWPAKKWPQWSHDPTVGHALLNACTEVILFSCGESVTWFQFLLVTWLDTELSRSSAQLPMFGFYHVLNSAACYMHSFRCKLNRGENVHNFINAFFLFFMTCSSNIRQNINFTIYLILGYLSTLFQLRSTEWGEKTIMNSE